MTQPGALPRRCLSLFGFRLKAPSQGGRRWREEYRFDGFFTIGERAILCGKSRTEGGVSRIDDLFGSPDEPNMKNDPNCSRAARELAPARLRPVGAAGGCDLLIFRLGLKCLEKDRSLVALDSSYTAQREQAPSPQKQWVTGRVCPALICPKTPCLLVSRRFNSQPE